jgi:hypothetical protein
VRVAEVELYLPRFVLGFKVLRMGRGRGGEELDVL